MSKKFRDYLLIVFAVFFIILSLLFSLYAAGYKLKLSWPLNLSSALQRTGMIIISTEPSSVNIKFSETEKKHVFSFLIKDIKSYTSPIKIKNLYPGDYILKLEKKDYWPLELKTSVYPGESTNLDKIRLFKKTTPLLIFETETDDYSFSPDKRLVYFPNSSKLVYLKSGLTKDLEPLLKQGLEDDINLSELNNSFIWSKDSSKLLVKNKVLDLNYLTIDNNFWLDSKIEEIQWLESSRRLYYIWDNKLFFINLTSDPKENILIDKAQIAALDNNQSSEDFKFLSFLIKNNTIYTIELDTSKEYYFRSYSLNRLELEHEFKLSPGDYELIEKNQEIHLYEKQNKLLYFIREGQDPVLSPAIKPVYAWQWLDQNRIFWQDQFNLNSLNLATGRQEQLFKFSKELTSFIWQEKKNYLLYSTEHEIILINLQNQEKERLSLFQGWDVKNLVLDEKNQILYFFASSDNGSGLHKLQLK